MLLKLLLIPLLAYAGIAGFLFVSQSRIIHLPDTPTRELTATPRQMGLPYQDADITTADGIRLHGWFVPAEAARGTALFFHGNAGNISHRLDSLLIFHRLGFNTLIVDYRGYGRSEGTPSEEGLYQDGLAALQYLQSEKGIPPHETVYFGRSLGGAVAAWLAARHPPRALVLESSFTSVPDMAAELYPWLPARLLARIRYDTREHLLLVRCPVLIVHSPQDDIIPFDHGRRLYETAQEPKTFLELQGDHNMGFLQSQPRYERELGAFLHAIFN